MFFCNFTSDFTGIFSLCTIKLLTSETTCIERGAIDVWYVDLLRRRRSV